MKADHLATILKEAQTKSEKSGWENMPEGTTLTLHLAHDGASLTVNRVEALKVDGELVYARTPKKDVVALAKEDLFAIGIEGSGVATQRRAGFG